MGLYFKYNILKAQNKIDTPKSPNSLLISTEFTNNQLFNGRFDSVKTTYQSFTIGYNIKGLKFEASAYYLIPKKTIDIYEIIASYQFEIKDKFSIEVNGTKYFYDSKSTNVKTAIQGAVGINLNYDIKNISFSLNSSY